MGILLLLLWVNQSIRSTELSYKIRSLEAEIQLEEKKRTVLEMKKNQLLSLSFIEEVSRKSGLVSPDPENIVIIKLDGERK